MTSAITDAFIFEAIRTPRGTGKRSGALHGVKPIDLVVGLIDELRGRFPDLDEQRISDVILGCVTPVGDQGMDIARTAATAAGMPDSVAGVQLNRFCGSGLESVNLAAKSIRSGFDEMIIAGGVESMSRVAMGSDGGAMAMDPATAYDNYFIPQGIACDLLATINGISRRDVDECAMRSQQLAAAAWSGGYFARSVVPVKDINGLTILAEDEHMRPEVTADGLGKLGSAFAGLAELGGFDDVAKQRYPHVERIDHVHTAGNSSGIVDGAALVLVGSEEAGRASGLTPRARIIAAATSGADPVLMFEGPIPVVNKALAIADLSVADIDVFEMNEAFAPSPCTSKRRSTSRTTATTSTAAPSPWATPWGRRGRGSARCRGSGAHRAAARHPERAHVGAAQRRPHEAIEGPQGGRGRRAGRHHRRAGARGQGLDRGEPGRSRAALGCPRLHDPRRHPVDPGVHGVSACLPGEPAPPAQRSADARSPGDHGRGRRGRPGRLRHGVDHRDPVLHQPGHPARCPKT